MARTRRTKINSTGVANYHVMSRTNDRRFLFEKASVKDSMLSALRRAAEFSGVRLRACTMMGNHFHAIVTVTRTDDTIPGDELLRRVGVLKGAKAQEELSAHWDDLVASGFTAKLDEEQDRLRRRMNDVSEFVKTFKEVFDRWYKASNEYCGSIWSGRFKSTLIEDGEYMRRCIRYVIYNPIRAGMVSRVCDYRWSWCEKDEKEEDNLGTVPNWTGKRIVQVGEGKVLGSAAFVMEMVRKMGEKFPAKYVGPHEIRMGENRVGDGTCTTHGWRLACGGKRTSKAGVAA